MNSRVCFPADLKNNKKGPFWLIWNKQSFNALRKGLQTTPRLLGLKAESLARKGGWVREPWVRIPVLELSDRVTVSQVGT